jgi:hypothetical protein
VIAYCADGSHRGGSLGAAGADRIIAAIELAVREGCPVVGIWHSGGARLADGVESMDGVGRMFAAMTAASGRVPQLSVVLGPGPRPTVRRSPTSPRATAAATPDPTGFADRGIPGGRRIKARPINSWGFPGKRIPYWKVLGS